MSLTYLAVGVLLFTEHAILPMFVSAHIGEPCNTLLKTCLPLSPHIYCDENFICRCTAEYPVQVGIHTCKKPKKFGERCSHPKECTFRDPNAYCTQTPYSSECQCLEGYTYSVAKGVCSIETSKNSTRKTELFLLPSAVGFLLASCGLFCCFIFVWHSFCRTRNSTDWTATSQNDTVGMSRRSRDIIRDPHDHHSRNSLGLLPGYDGTLYDQPPPSYDEAIKGDIVPSTSHEEAYQAPKEEV